MLLIHAINISQYGLLKFSYFKAFADDGAHDLPKYKDFYALTLHNGDYRYACQYQRISVRQEPLLTFRELRVRRTIFHNAFTTTYSLYARRNFQKDKRSLGFRKAFY